MMFAAANMGWLKNLTFQNSPPFGKQNSRNERSFRLPLHLLCFGFYVAMCVTVTLQSLTWLDEP